MFLHSAEKFWAKILLHPENLMIFLRCCFIRLLEKLRRFSTNFFFIIVAINNVELFLNLVFLLSLSLNGNVYSLDSPVKNFPYLYIVVCQFLNSDIRNLLTVFQVILRNCGKFQHSRIKFVWSTLEKST